MKKRKRTKEERKRKETMARTDKHGNIYRRNKGNFKEGRKEGFKLFMKGG